MATDITVCICTYKRPQFLRWLLENLDKQQIGKLTFSAVVVDNDSDRSAQQAVKETASTLHYNVRYLCEPYKNIAAARNAAVRAVMQSPFLAFIDDDEFPQDDWLSLMHRECVGRGCDGVLGPVVPYFRATAPRWLVKSGLCDRRRFKTGTQLLFPKDMRTGNVFIKSEIFTRSNMFFDHNYGLTGGEDTEFFRKALDQGVAFSWCDEGVVYEEVPADRLTRKYHLKRALLRGTVNGRKTVVVSLPVFKSLVASVIYLPALPFLHLAGHHHFMKYLVKSFDHLGLLLASMGIEVEKKR